MQLVWPSQEYLPGYLAALEQNWSPDNVRCSAAAQEELQLIDINADGFLAAQVDREAKGGPITLPDGSSVSRLPGYRRWLWDGEFCGVISLRWQLGTEALPPHCLGHIGYSIVPWKQNRGYAKEALRQMLPEAKKEGVAYVEITTDPSNIASQRVILANDGVLFEKFTKPAQFGGKDGLRFRIPL